MIQKILIFIVYMLGLIWPNVIIADDVITIQDKHILKNVVTADDVITIHGNDILKNGKSFITKGVIFEGFIEPESWLQECIDKKKDKNNYCYRHLDSRNYFYGNGSFVGRDALSLAIKDWNINSVRFNLSQTALDPKSKWYTPSYINEIKKLVTTSRKKGLVVYLTLFAATNLYAPQMLLDRNPIVPLNTDVSERAAVVLAQNFGQDGGVILETLNEPWPPTKWEIGWKLWKDGGILKNKRSRFNGMDFVGNQQMVDSIRATGAKNAIVVQLLRRHYKFFPGNINDPINKVIYSIHPFFRESVQNEKLWDKKIGDFASKHPFVITAWNARTKRDWCEVSGIDTVENFLRYLNQRDIGLIGYAFDTPYTITRNYKKYYAKPMSLGKECKDKGWGSAGRLIQKSFLGDLGLANRKADVRNKK